MYLISDSQASERYNNYYKDYSSYNKLLGLGSDYTSDEKGMLKKFYKTLATKFHPDSNQDIDTTKEMQMLNRLKGEWKL